MTSPTLQPVGFESAEIGAQIAQHGRDKQKLLLLEIGRAIAALLVVLHHADQATAHFSDVPRERLFLWAQYGVDFFFVLSGFIIYYTHKDDPKGIVPARLYLFKRLTRIFVPYFPVAFAYMGLLLVFQDGPMSERPWSVWATITLLPMEKSSALTVAWTLTYELMFYILFFLSYASMRLFSFVGAFWAILLLSVLFGFIIQPEQATLYALLNPIVLEFFFGILAAHYAFRISSSLRWWILAGGILLMTAVVLTWSGQRALLGPPLALFVLAASMFRLERSTRSIDLAVFLGAASYAIYLVHSPVISIIAELLQPLGFRPMTFLTCLTLGTGLGVLYHITFERPALRAVRRWQPAKA